MPFPTTRARQHVESLCLKHRITLRWVRSWADAHAYPGSRAVALPVIQTGREYLVALHELGHVMSRQARRLEAREDPGGQMAREAWAWAWAAEHADKQLAGLLTVEDWKRIGEAFGSYIRYHALP